MQGYRLTCPHLLEVKALSTVMARMDFCFWLVLAISYVAIVHQLGTMSHRQMRASNGTNITLINDLHLTPKFLLEVHDIHMRQLKHLDQVNSAISLAQRHRLAPAWSVFSSETPKAVVDHDEQLPTATMKKQAIQKWLLKHGLRDSNGTNDNHSWKQNPQTSGSDQSPATRRLNKWLHEHGLRASNGTNDHPILLPGSTILLPGRSTYPDLTYVLPVSVDQQFSLWFYLMYLYTVLILIIAACVQVLC